MSQRKQQRNETDSARNRRRQDIHTGVGGVGCGGRGYCGRGVVVGDETHMDKCPVPVGCTSI